MEYIHGCTFGFMSRRGFTEDDRWKESMRLMAEGTGCNTLVLPVGALQDHTWSTKVDYTTDDVMSMDDVRRVCAYARELGLKVIIKAMVNCRDGYWRAYIRFFDHEVPCEPRWADWFASYASFVTALAQTAQECGAEMFCVGCEMVGTDHRADDWRSLISEVRKVYHGPVTYNCDKYQEEHVTWWDAVDLISSSGYYPINDLERQFARVEAVSAKWNKPFFFMESGCPSREDSEYIPNDWRAGGKQSNEAQRAWYAAYTEALLQHPQIRGTVWWDWSAVRLYPLEAAATNNDYALYGKPACECVKSFAERLENK